MQYFSWNDHMLSFQVFNRWRLLELSIENMTVNKTRHFVEGLWQPLTKKLEIKLKQEPLPTSKNVPSYISGKTKDRGLFLCL